MTNAINFTTPPNPTVSAASGPAPVQPARKEDPPKDQSKQGGQLANLRLVIEEDEDGVGFIYKTLDRRTGEVVQVFPREELLKMASADDYSPGTVVDQHT